MTAAEALSLILTEAECNYDQRLAAAERTPRDLLRQGALVDAAAVLDTIHQLVKKVDQ